MTDPDIDGTDGTDPAPCPCCGSLTGSTLSVQTSVLLAVCDILVIRALEAVGKKIIRQERSRFARFGHRPWHEAHTVWAPPRDDMVQRDLANAWEIVPAMLDVHGCCGVTSRQVTETLDSYVRDLLITGTPHDVTQLRYRLESRLGVPLTEPLVPAAARVSVPS